MRHWIGGSGTCSFLAAGRRPARRKRGDDHVVRGQEDGGEEAQDGVADIPGSAVETARAEAGTLTGFAPGGPGPEGTQMHHAHSWHRARLRAPVQVLCAGGIQIGRAHV